MTKISEIQFITPFTLPAPAPLHSPYSVAPLSY